MDSDQLREAVAKAYADVAKKGSGCCGSGGGSLLSRIAGYSQEDLSSVPEEAVELSLGCGNPLAFGQLAEGDVVLDLGSGAGIDLILASRKVGKSGSVIGIDMTEEMIAKARENIERAGLDNVEVRKGYIEDLPVDSSTVDWVISNCVINLSPDKPKVFAEIARVLKPGGRMLLSDIVVEELPDWLRKSMALYASCLAGAISEEEYIQGLRGAGLEDVEVKNRLIYRASQLAALADADGVARELVSRQEGSGCSPPAELVAKVVEEVEGRVWSALFYARKPED